MGMRLLCMAAAGQRLFVPISDMSDGRTYEFPDRPGMHALDSTQEYESVSSKPARGGSFGGAAGPVALNGKLVLSSGYGIYNHMPGNLLLVLE